MTIAINSIEIPQKYFDICEDWKDFYTHDGQDSMLYAIASTGNLTLGNLRPNVFVNQNLPFFQQPMTDKEWYWSLFDDLEHELRNILLNYSRYTTNPYYNEEKEYQKLVDFLHWTIDIVSKLESEYKIEI